MADIDIFGDEPVVSMEEKEPEDKEELKDQEETMTEDQNEQPEGQPVEAIVIPDEKVQDGGVIDDDVEAKTEPETAVAVAETAVQPVEPAKPAEIEPYISETDTVQVFICVVATIDRGRLIVKLH